MTPEPREADVPVLTQVVEDAPAAPARTPEQAGFDELALQLERALLERLGPEIDGVTARAFDKMRGELTVAVLRMVREAVAESLARSKRG